MHGLDLTLWNSLSGLFQMKRSKTWRAREERALCCVFPVLPPFRPLVLVCIVTAGSHPSERLVGGWSGEKILLWEPAAERDLITVWLLKQGKRWASLACENQGAREAWLGSPQTLRRKSWRRSCDCVLLLMRKWCCAWWSQGFKFLVIIFLKIILEGKREMLSRLILLENIALHRAEL